MMLEAFFLSMTQQKSVKFCNPKCTSKYVFRVCLITPETYFNTCITFISNLKLNIIFLKPQFIVWGNT